MVTVFVYGTLRDGGAAAWMIDGPRRPATLGDHALYGRSHPYPFVAPLAGSIVQGEVADVPASRLADLDEYEGDEYVRVEATVQSDEGTVVAQVWVAKTDPPLPASELIPSGDWFDR